MLTRNSTDKTGNRYLHIAVAALAVLLVCGAVVGAVSAETISAEDWNNLTSITKNYEITGDGIIKPISSMTVTGTSTVDFSGYKGTFAGKTDVITDNIGALFGSVNIGTGVTLTIKNLNMTSVKVTSSKDYVGGIVGCVKGASTENSFLKFENCNFVNCSVSGGNYVGGLVGHASFVDVNAANCHLQHCDVTLENNNIGGLVGFVNNANVRLSCCGVYNSVISGMFVVGGLVGRASTSAKIDISDCEVGHTSLYTGIHSAGGLVGNTYTDYNTAKITLSSSNVTNCVIVSDNYGGGSTDGINIGGLVGGSYSTATINACGVVNCTVSGTDHIGGLVGYTSNTNTLSNNYMKNCAVNASDSNAHLVSGDRMLENSYNCIIVSPNYIRNTTYPNTDITPHNGWKAPALTHVTANGITVTSLGQYGQIGGYGVGSAPSLTYHPNGAAGSIPPGKTYPAGSTVTAAEQGTLTKDGHIFNGWNTKADGSGTAYAAGETFTLTAHTVLYAQWLKTEYTITIPADITLTDGETSSCEITLTYQNVPSEKQIIVEMSSANSYKLIYTSETSADETIYREYQVQSEEGTPLSDNTPILTVSGHGAGTQNQKENLQISFTDDDKPAYAGTYTDTLTFTASLEDIGT